MKNDGRSFEVDLKRDLSPAAFRLREAFVKVVADEEAKGEIRSADTILALCTVLGALVGGALETPGPAPPSVSLLFRALGTVTGELIHANQMRIKGTN